MRLRPWAVEPAGVAPLKVHTARAFDAPLALGAKGDRSPGEYGGAGREVDQVLARFAARER